MFYILGSVLAGHVISKSQVPTRIDCAFVCLRNQRCVSYNFEEGNKAVHECELNSEGKDRKSANLTSKAGYSYYGTERNVSNSRHVSVFSLEIRLKAAGDIEPAPSGLPVSDWAQVVLAATLTIDVTVCCFSSRIT